MTHQKPTALFSKKAGALPIRFFSWSAASLATIAALSSYGTPAFAHHFRYRDIIPDDKDYDLMSHPNYNQIVPICTSEDMKGDVGDLDTLIQGTVVYVLSDKEIARTTRNGHRSIHHLTCHGGDNRDPIVTKALRLNVGTRAVRLDVLDNTIRSFNLDENFSDPDGDDLTYTVTSSHPDNVRAVVSGNTLTIGALKSRLLPITITVTADDGNGGTVSDSFTVTVGQGDSTSTGSAPLDYATDIAEEFAKNAAVDVGLKAGGAVVGGLVAGPPGAAVGAAAGSGVSKLITSWQVGRAAGKGTNMLINSTEVNHNGEEFNRLAETLYIHHQALQDGSISLDQAFSGQTFSLPFSLSQASPEDQDASPRRFNALFTGSVDFTSFSDSTPGLHFDGSTTAYGLGINLIPNPDVPLLTGLHLAFTNSNADLQFRDTEQGDAKGSYNLQMFSLHPSIAWDATDNLTLWTTLGYGRPNTETTINSIAGVDVEDASHSSSGDFFSFAGGANYRVWQSDASALSLNLSGSTASFLDNDFQKGRIAAQFSHDFPLNSGQLNSSADLALLLSNSNPSTAELSGQLDWLPNQGRLSGSTNARVLLFGGDRSEWGIGGSVVLLPGERGEGLSLSLQPSFGQTNASLSSLHLDPFSFSDPTELALSTAPLTARFNAELAYGFPTGNYALLTPYTKLSMGHYGTTTSAGLRYQLDNSLDLDLSASHRTHSSGNNDNRFFLQLRSDL